MKGSLERVRRVMSHEKPDRIPLFDLLPNDAILQYFNDGKPVEPDDDRSAARAYAAATDATRHSKFAPREEKTEVLPDGREIKTLRWTSWYEHRKFASSEEYSEIKRREIEDKRAISRKPIITADNDIYKRDREIVELLGDDYYYFAYSESPLLMAIFGEVGLEEFSYYLYDCEDEIIGQLESNAEYACRLIDGLPDDDPFEGIFMGDDMAFKTGTLVSPTWMKKHYFPLLKPIIDALHGKGKKVIFHSDGNLNSVMDSLLECGIDALNPIEVAAGMDIADLHRRYPKLIFVGGIDVSNLLPFGTPQQIRDAVTKAIEDSEGKILVGSTTEVHNDVPLENFLAMRDAAIDYRF